jgi:hypothetical protein
MKSIMSDFDNFSKVWFESTVFNSTANELLKKNNSKLLLEVEKLKNKPPQRKQCLWESYSIWYYTVKEAIVFS